MPQVSTASCDRCNGTGEYHGTRRDGSSYTGRCFACQGYRPNRAAYRRAFGVEPVPAITLATVACPPPGLPVPALGLARGVDALRAFSAAHPAEYQWLANANAAGVNFAASLLAGLQRYGNLTPRQLAAVQRNLNLVEPVTAPAPVTPERMLNGMAEAVTAAVRETEQAVAQMVATVAPVAPVTIDMAEIFRAFDTAAASGLRKVRLTLGAVELKRTGERFRFGGAGLVMVYVSGVYKGVVGRDNVFRVGAGRTMEPLNLELVRNAVANPRAAAATHGHDTGYCSCCRRLLTDPPSVMAGIGPVCIRRFGWSF